MPRLSRAELKLFLTGLGLRLACAPYLLSWYHADERQMLEFAHFHAHGRLHPFMEAGLHMRNQTAPWLFSWLIRACDLVGLDSPRAWLWAIDAAVAGWTWLGFWALLGALEQWASPSPRLARAIGWFFALFWGFNWLWTRPLTEALSFTPAALLFAAVLSRRWFRAGAWAALAGILRYPSFLFAPGAVLMALFLLRQERAPGRAYVQGLGWATLGFVLVLGLGGLADSFSYGQWLASLPAYFSYNRPGGPVSQYFGNDDLGPYIQWFTFLLTPWLALPVAALAAGGCLRTPVLLAFAFPYIVGHLWTPHREPRFLLPVTPFLAWGLFAWLASPEGSQVWVRVRDWLGGHPVLKQTAGALAVLHLLLNFAWFPALAWAQIWTGQGILLRSYYSVKKHRTDLLNLAEAPLGAIDAWIPPASRWAGPDCHWHRPDTAMEAERTWVLTRDTVPGTCHLLAGLGDLGRYRLAERWLRVRFANLYECPRESLTTFCPQGMPDPGPGEPYFGKDLSGISATLRP